MDKQNIVVPRTLCCAILFVLDLFDPIFGPMLFLKGEVIRMTPAPPDKNEVDRHLHRSLRVAFSPPSDVLVHPNQSIFHNHINVSSTEMMRPHASATEGIPSCEHWIGLDWIGIRFQAGLNWTGLGWIGLDWIGPVWTG